MNQRLKLAFQMCRFNLHTVWMDWNY
jgi:hypothetical protein